MASEQYRLQTEIQDYLPPGFKCFGGEFYFEPGTDEEWFRLQYTYCDRHKYLAVRKVGMPSAFEIADQIMLTPILADCPEDHYKVLVRCLKKVMGI